MPRKFFHWGAARGFSLVELMVAMTISLMLLAGVVAIFSSSRTSYESTDQRSRLQETGRFALDTISRHIRAAGFVGCARQPTYLSTSLNNATYLQWNFLEGPVRGFQATGATWAPTIAPADPAVEPDPDISTPTPGSDVLVLRVPARDAIPVRLLADMGVADGTLSVDTSLTDIRQNDVVLAYSCEAQSVFQVTNYNSGTGVISHASIAATATSPGNAEDTINYAYRRDVTEVVPVQTVVYYVDDSTGAPNTTSLFRRVAMNPSEELLEGVEQMQLQFGVDTNGDLIVDDYRTADLVTDWRTVISVSVALLVRSIDEFGLDRDPRTYQLFEVTAPAVNDRRQRDVFMTTASIRNRIRVN
jgi:type IV pilus assembly protein PilW